MVAPNTGGARKRDALDEAVDRYKAAHGGRLPRDPIPQGATYARRIAGVILDLTAQVALFERIGAGMSALAYKEAIDTLTRLPGVPEAILDSAFDVLRRADSARKRG